MLPGLGRGSQCWSTLVTDDDTVFDTVVDLDASNLEPFVTWGTNPGQGVQVSETVQPSRSRDEDRAPRR